MLPLSCPFEEERLENIQTFQRRTIRSNDVDEIFTRSVLVKY